MAQHFRFLDLPKELRLMCYERMPVTTHHHTVRGISPSSPTLTFSNATLVTKSISCSILSVCHRVHTEANTIFAPLLQRLHASPTRLIIELGASKFMLPIFQIFFRIARNSTSIANTRNNMLLTLMEQTHAIDKSAATSFILAFAASISRSCSTPQTPLLVIAVTQGPSALPENASTQFNMIRRRIFKFIRWTYRRKIALDEVETSTLGFSIVLPKDMDLHSGPPTTTHDYVQRDSARFAHYVRAEWPGEQGWREEWEVGEWIGI